MPKIALEGWQIKTIDDLVVLQYGKSPKDVLSDDGRYPVIGTGGITGYATSYLHDGNTTVIGRKGTINKPSYIEGRFWAIDTTYFATNYKNVDPKWFFYILNSFDLSKYNEASGVPSLGRDTLYTIPLLTPPLPEQQKIATILSSVDNVIEKTRTQIDKLKDLKTGMMQELLTKGIGHTEFKDSPLGRVPASWKVMQLCDIAQINPRLVSKPQDSFLVSFVKMEDVSNDTRLIAAHDKNFADVSKGFTNFADGDVLFAKITPCMENGKGAFVVGLTNGIGFGSTEFHVIRAKSKEVAKWIYHLTSGKQFREKAAGFMTGSAGQRRVPTDFLKEVEIAMPGGLAEIKEIVVILDSIDKQIISTEQQFKSHNKLKKALMQDLLTGKVRVSIDSEEVAVA